MELFIILWLGAGFAWWVRHQGYKAKMGIVGDYLIGLPLCFIFGPAPFINELLEK